MGSFKIWLTILPLILCMSFLPEKSVPAQIGEWTIDYTIRVKYAEKMLVLTDESGWEIAVYPVAVPREKPGNLPYEGRVAGIERNPFWYPTPATRKYYFENKKIELPAVISPGDPRNAMGAAKILIDFVTAGVDPAIRIHGTNDPSSIGTRISQGCIRMRNADILALVNILEGKKARVFFE